MSTSERAQWRAEADCSTMSDMTKLWFERYRALDDALTAALFFPQRMASFLGRVGPAWDYPENVEIALKQRIEAAERERDEARESAANLQRDWDNWRRESHELLRAVAEAAVAETEAEGASGIYESGVTYHQLVSDARVARRAAVASWTRREKSG